MPNETNLALKYAREQYIEEDGIKFYVERENEVDRFLLVHFVREYFNDHNIEYDTFSYKDLEPFLS